MFKNELTDKMPCWLCTKLDKCFILESLMSALESREGMIVRHNITGITFKCSRREQRPLITEV